ncbi:MAG: 50S ribosomal protein L7/L12 [Bacteroidota bacterium]
MEKIEQIAEALVALSVKEVNMLANLMKEKYDIAPAAAAVAAVPVASAEGEEGKEQKEKTIFDVELTSAGDTRLRVIKAIKDALSLSLKDAKDFVDGAPQIMKEKVTKEEAEALKKTLEEVGAKITLK